MGDLVQTAPLLSRLEHEWPGVAIDLAVDTRFAPMALLLPGLRQVLTYDFHEFLSTRQDHSNRSEALPVELTEWINPLKAAGYDRVINLTFTRWSGFSPQRSACRMHAAPSPSMGSPS
jgi:ADP-heptose:LPS heptosyltransferase